MCGGKEVKECEKSIGTGAQMYQLAKLDAAQKRAEAELITEENEKRKYSFKLQSKMARKAKRGAN